MGSGHKFRVGQRVRPSLEGIDANLFAGTFRGQRRADWSGVVVYVDRLNSPTILWDWLKTKRSYHPNFVAPDRRRKKAPRP